MYVEEPAPRDLSTLRTQNFHNISKTQYREKSGLAEPDDNGTIYKFYMIVNYLVKKKN